MDNKQFNVDEWVYHDFELVLIKEMDDDKITHVSDGSFSIMGTDMNKYCFPIDMNIKKISDLVKQKWDEILDLDFKSLNHYDIKRKFIEYWVFMCENVDEDNEVYTDYLNKFLAFSETIINKIKELKSLEVNNIKIFK